MSVDRLSKRISNTVVRGVVTLQDSGRANGTTFAEEPQTEMGVAQPAGFASNGGEMDAIIVALGANASSRVAVVTMDRSGVVAGQGEAIIYSPENPENRVVIDADGIRIISESITISGDSVDIDADEFSWRGKRVVIDDDIDDDGDRIIAGGV